MLFWIKFGLLVLLRIALSVVLIPVELLCSLLWKPAFKYAPSAHCGDVIYIVKDVLTKSAENINVRAYAMCGDGPKFIGMAIPVLPPSEQRAEAIGAYLSFYDDKANTLRRYSAQHQAAIDASPAFSGDMIAGYLFAFIEMARKCLTSTKKDSPEYAEENAFVLSAAKIIYSTHHNFVYSGMPFKMPHPTKKDNSRGFIWSPWEPGYGPILAAIAYLRAVQLATALAGGDGWQAPYDRLGRIVKVFEFMAKYLTISRRDVAYFRGTTYFKSWYTEHTMALNAHIALVTATFGLTCPAGLTRERMFEYAPYATLVGLQSRYPWNADIAALRTLAYVSIGKQLWGDVPSQEIDRMLAEAAFEISTYPLSARVGKTVSEYEVEAQARAAQAVIDAGLERYFSLKSFKSKMMNSRIVPAICMAPHTGYLGEANRLSPDVKCYDTDVTHVGMTLDGAFPAYYYSEAVRMCDEPSLEDK